MNTPYLNTIAVSEQPKYPGNLSLEGRIRSLIRWNAMAMVVRANRQVDGIGGHISTFASAATLYEVGFQHFFRGKNHPCGGDQIYFQGHASPGIYARAFLEGRLSEKKLENFRRELAKGGGLSSYPHPWLMPDFWEYPTVSMGLGPLMAIYQARFNRYLENRNLKKKTDAKVWAFLGDGETDEPEALGAITLASRENLDNLIFVVNCNLQRLDGPVRGNGKIIQELESVFSGAGWNVIKVIWGSDWDPLLEKDTNGLLKKRMQEVVDGQYQKYAVSSGAYIRNDFFGTDPSLKKLVENLSDTELQRLRRGGHDPIKVYAAYAKAMETVGKPTLILAKTIKGYGLGEAGEGKNITHQQKKLNEDELRDFRTRFGIPISDEEVAKAPFYKPPTYGPEVQYLEEHRQKLGGYLPSRKVKSISLKLENKKIFEEFYQGEPNRSVSTTMVFVRILSQLLRDQNLGKKIIPIIPDEARTFGMESLFKQYGIYSSKGQLYAPVDSENLFYYREAKDGQILEEGITEAGSMSSFISAGTSYAAHQLPLIPFFIFYSMFGFQRIGDLIWAAGDMRTRGFLLGATAGRTTLAGEGLQHQDGQSHLFAYPYPNVISYDPAYAFELAVIIEDGLKRMFEKQEDLIYYITLYNENYPMPSIPITAYDRAPRQKKGSADRRLLEKIKEGILKGLYLFQSIPTLPRQEKGKNEKPSKKLKRKINLMGSGPILNEVLKAASILEKEHKIFCNIWSVTSYKQLYQDAIETEKWNLENPTKKKKTAYLTECLKKEENGIFIAASDYVRALPDSIAKWIPGQLISLGTDGFGMSESREKLREHFGVNAKQIVKASLYALKNLE